ncbi:hypothetical protein O7626_40605 [Micromonospora sp. WMMD1102]|uniref:hypothetical protein n=1 Tax=Micromonospora sp. WMMD1102 TaxID=3016105 RepID=UPI0024159415|nr:hypothetical protein [Micromonospora sp. WMMD1102]MDG4792119.1 hypothetical protein [Micromonospora sp. WMMD1102]
MSEYDTAPSKPNFERRPADHPHTDPGDGRQECDRCGKFIWPAIHSCKGVPVTAAARARWEAAHAVEPVTAPNPADVELVAAALAAAGNERMAAQMAKVNGEWGVPYRADEMVELAVDALTALAGAGRLLPVGARTATQFGVRFTRADGSSWVSECSQRAAEDRAEFYAKRRAEGPHQIVSAEVVQRDGGSWVGPWRPVPSTQETP